MLEVAGEGVRVARPRQKRDDALEISEQRVAFEIPLASEEPPEGSARLTGKLWFGICKSDLVCERVGHEFETALR